MNDPNAHQGWMKIGVAAELAKHYSADERSFLKTLAALLQGALSDDEVRVETSGWFANKTIKRVSLTLGDDLWALEDTGRGPLVASRMRVVRGIKLKSETLPVADWLQAVGVALDERAKTSQAARDALAKLVDF